MPLLRRTIEHLREKKKRKLSNNFRENEELKSSVYETFRKSRRFPIASTGTWGLSLVLERIEKTNIDEIDKVLCILFFQMTMEIDDLIDEKIFNPRKLRNLLTERKISEMYKIFERITTDYKDKDEKAYLNRVVETFWQQEISAEEYRQILLSKENASFDEVIEYRKRSNEPVVQAMVSILGGFNRTPTRNNELTEHCLPGVNVAQIWDDLNDISEDAISHNPNIVLASIQTGKPGDMLSGYTTKQFCRRPIIGEILSLYWRHEVSNLSEP